MGIEAIINRVTVHGSDRSQKDWLVETEEEFGIENVILVGGESGKIKYSGPSVVRLSEVVGLLNSDNGTEIFLGGIAYLAERLSLKECKGNPRSGIDFFTTQVLYDSKDICKMLTYYGRL